MRFTLSDKIWHVKYGNTSIVNWMLHLVFDDVCQCKEVSGSKRWLKNVIVHFFLNCIQTLLFQYPDRNIGCIGSKSSVQISQGSHITFQ